MKRAARGPVYSAGVFVLVAGLLVLAAASLTVLFRGKPAFRVEVFGSTERPRARPAGADAIRSARPAEVRQGSLGDPERLRYAAGFTPWADPAGEGGAAAPRDQLLDMARIWASQEQWDRSLQAYDSLVAARPDDGALALERARVLSWAGNPAGAGDALLAAGREGDPSLQVEAARYYWWGGRLGAADSLLSAARAAGSVDPELPKLQEEVRRAMTPDVRTATRWLGENGGWREQLALARALAAEKEHGRAIRHYRASLATGGAPDSVYLELASTAAAAESSTVVVSTLTQYLRRHPRDRNARVTLARAYGWAENYPAATRAYRELLNAQDEPELRFELGQILAWSGQQAEAELELRRVATAEPRHAPTFRLLGDLARWRGNWDVALLSYRHAADLDPTLPLAADLAETERQRELARLAAMPVRIDECRVAVQTFADNLGFRWLASEASQTWRPGWGQVTLAVNQSYSAGDAPIPQDRAVDGYGFRFAADARVARGVSVGVQLGNAGYGSFGTFTTWGAGVAFSDLLGASVSLNYSRQPALRRASTLASLQAGVTADVVQLVASRSAGAWSAWSQVEAERLRSGLGATERYTGALALRRQLGSRLSASVGVSALATRGDNPTLPGWGSLYWAPDYYVEPNVGLAYSAPLGRNWRLGASVRPGYAFVREREGAQARFGSGGKPTLGVGADLTYRGGRWTVTGSGDWSGAAGSGYRAAIVQVEGAYSLGAQ